MTEEQKTLKVCVEAVRKRLFMAVYAPKALLAEVEAAVKECRNEIL
jgi:hypothetical protein